MLKNISTLGWCYFTYSALACGYFVAAAVGGWKAPNFDSIGGSGYGSSYSSGGSSYGRSSGGSWGGGK